MLATISFTSWAAQVATGPFDRRLTGPACATSVARKGRQYKGQLGSALATLPEMLQAPLQYIHGTQHHETTTLQGPSVYHIPTWARPNGFKYLYNTFIGPNTKDIRATLRPRYISHNYKDPSSIIYLTIPYHAIPCHTIPYHNHQTIVEWNILCGPIGHWVLYKLVPWKAVPRSYVRIKLLSSTGRQE